MSKAQILAHLATQTGLTRAQVDSVLDELEVLVMRHVKKRAVGEFTLPGLLKIRSVKRPATKKRMGRNPATGEQIEIPARPATTRVRGDAAQAPQGDGALAPQAGHTRVGRCPLAMAEHDAPPQSRSSETPPRTGALSVVSQQRFEV